MTTCAPTTLDEAIQGAVLAALTDTLVPQRLTRTPDSSGGTTEAWADQAPVPCYIAPTGGADLIVADRLGLVDTYTILVPWGSPIRAQDRVVAGGVTFQVSYVPDYDSGHSLAALIGVVVA